MHAFNPKSHITLILQYFSIVKSCLVTNDNLNDLQIMIASLLFEFNLQCANIYFDIFLSYDAAVLVMLFIIIGCLSWTSKQSMNGR